MTRKSEDKGTFSAIESTARTAIEQGEKVWLAGLGVLARTQEDSREWLAADKAEMFDEYVSAGRDFADRAKGSSEAQFESTRDAVRGAFDKAREQAKSGYERAVSQTEVNVEKIAESFGIDQVFDRRIERALERLGYPTAKQFDELKKKVSASQRKVATKKVATKKKAAKKKSA